MNCAMALFANTCFVYTKKKKRKLLCGMVNRETQT